MSDRAAVFFDGLARRLGLPAVDSGVAAVDLLPALQTSVGASYRIERELGGGGMSRVFLAHEIALARPVVIKTLPPDMVAAVNVERFRREIAVVAQLQHPHIVPLYAASASGDFLYYTMPYVAGESLRDELARTGALPVSDALRVWRDVLDALAYAHASGVVHRDVKPANILLSGRHALVADFGIARAIEAAAAEGSATRTGPLGTPAYMAPEQASGGRVDHRADLYAAGLVMYEMLAGHTPFADATSAREYVVAHLTRAPEPLRRADVPAPLAELVMQCLAKNPAERTPTADALLARLDELTSHAGHSRAWTERRPVRVALGALLVASSLGAAYAAWRAPPARASTGARHLAPDTVVRLYQRGLAEQRRRTLDGAVEAMSLFEHAIAIDSEFSLGWAAIARTAQFADNRGWAFPGRDADSLLSLAVRASRRAVELDSASAEAWTVAGKVAGAVDLQDRAATVHALQRALRIDSTYAEAWFELGLAYEESLRPADAERAWLRAASLNPANVQVLGFLGWHYLWYDDYPRGLRWADSAIAVEPTYFLARDGAALLALAMHRPDIAMRHAEAVRRTRGHEPSVVPSITAIAAARQGNLTLARRYAREAEAALAQPLPSKHEATYLAGAWAAAGDTARARHWLAAYPHQSDLHFRLHVQRDPDLRWAASAVLPRP